MVPAVCRGVSPRAQAIGQPRYRYWRIMEVRHTHALALSFRPACNALPRVRLPPVPRALLMEPRQTSDTGRMGERTPSAGEGCRRLHLVAVTDAMAQIQQSPRARALQ